MPDVNKQYLTVKELMELKEEFQSAMDESVKDDNEVGMDSVVYATQIALINRLIKLAQQN